MLISRDPQQTQDVVTLCIYMRSLDARPNMHQFCKLLADTKCRKEDEFIVFHVGEHRLKLNRMQEPIMEVDFTYYTRDELEKVNRIVEHPAMFTMECKNNQIRGTVSGMEPE